MSETMKNLIEAAIQAAQSVSEAQATRLQGVIQGYAMACESGNGGDDSGKEKAK